MEIVVVGDKKAFVTDIRVPGILFKIQAILTSFSETVELVVALIVDRISKMSFDVFLFFDLSLFIFSPLTSS